MISISPLTRNRVIFWLLLSLAMALGIYLIIADKPWQTPLWQGAYPPPQEAPLSDCIIVGSWGAALLNLIAALGLLCTRKLWLTEEKEALRATPLPTPPISRGVWLATALIIVAGIYLRAPRLDHSLWSDEEYTLRKYTWGYLDEKEDSSLKFRRVSWEETFWFNRGSNNHIAYSIDAKLSLILWDKFFRAKDDYYFSEVALRLPAFLASLGTIFLVILLGVKFGMPRAGILAAALLTIHPWHIRYSVEARGYSYMLLFILLSTFFLWWALHSSRWKYWLGYGACQFLYLWSFPGAIYVAIIQNTALALYLGYRAVQLQKWQPLRQWLVANVLAAMVYIQMLGPSAPQIWRYLQREVAHGSMGWPWIADIWAHFTGGVRWASDPGEHSLWATAQSLQASEGGFYYPYILVFIPILLIVGFVALWRKDRIAGFLICTPLVAILLNIGHNLLTGNFLYSWYLLYALPFLLFIMAACLLAISSRWKMNSIAAGGAILASYVMVMHTPIRLIRNHDRQPFRQVVASVVTHCGAQSATEPSYLMGVFGTSKWHLTSYAPRIAIINSEEDIVALEKRAQSEGKPLYVICSGKTKEERVNPGLVSIVENGSRFEKIDTVYGLEELFTFHVYQSKTLSTLSP